MKKKVFVLLFTVLICTQVTGCSLKDTIIRKVRTSIKSMDDKEAIAVQINNSFYKVIPVEPGYSDKTAIRYEKENCLK